MSDTAITILFVLIDLSIIISGFSMCFIKRNDFVGFRTPTTLSDPYVWKKTNMYTGFMFVLLGILCFFPAIYGRIVLFGVLLVIGLIVIIIFGIIYSNRLREKRLKEIADHMQSFVISKQFLYAMAIISIIMVIIGIVMLFVPPNDFIGIRIPKILSNPVIWHKVNSISGIGFIVLGIVFSILFFRDTSLCDEDRTNNFRRHFIWFTIFTILWSSFGVALAYLLA